MQRSAACALLTVSGLKSQLCMPVVVNLDPDSEPTSADAKTVRIRRRRRFVSGALHIAFFAFELACFVGAGFLGGYLGVVKRLYPIDVEHCITLCAKPPECSHENPR